MRSRTTAAILFALTVCAGCSGESGAEPSVDPLVLGKHRTRVFTETCDGSAGVAIDADNFLDFNDENQDARIYPRRGGAPVQTLGLNAALGLAGDAEADLEDAARIGDRIYVVGSHGRNKDGELAPSRSIFFALDRSGALPKMHLDVAGASSTLLVDLLDGTQWDTPNTNVIRALASSSSLSTPSDPALAPERDGINVEGLAAYPSLASPKRLLIGLRNPQVGGAAVFVTLTNPDALIAGSRAHFGQAILLDLDGLGVRGLVWSDAHDAMLILAGPHDAGGPFALYAWAGDPTTAAVRVADITPPADGAPEAVIAYPGSKDVQILFDQGDAKISGKSCKKAKASARRFEGLVVHVD